MFNESPHLAGIAGRSATCRIVRWFAGGLALFAFGVLVTITRGVTIADEGWFLQVVHRVSSGETLYRDVFFGVTPLSVYVTSAFAAFLGTEVLTLRALMALCFAMTVLLSCRISRMFNPERGFPFFLAAALVVFAAPETNSPYAAMANIFFLVSFAAVLAWMESREKRASDGANRKVPAGLLAAAGFAAGLCFAAKQNIGLYALAAVLLSVAFVAGRNVPGERELRVGVSVILASYLLASALLLAPVWFSGGSGKFLEYGFLNKKTYLRLAGTPYFNGLSDPAAIREVFRSARRFREAIRFLLPFLTFGALGAALLRAERAERGRAATVFLFVGAAFLGVFPRADSHHLHYAVPEILLGLSYSWPRLNPGPGKRFVRFSQAGLALALAIGVGAALKGPAGKIVTGNYRISPLPHYRGILMDPDQYDRSKATAGSLVQIAGSGERLFILSPDAGFYYLVTGLKNPTPYDYPYATAFGFHGESEVIDAISRGHIRSVCLDGRKPYPQLTPARLEAYVVGNMERGPDLGVCTLYHLRRGPLTQARGAVRQAPGHPLPRLP